MGAGALWSVGPAHGETVPPLQAFSAFFYTVDFLRSVMGLPVATLQQLETAVVAVCNQTWSQVRPTPAFPGVAQEAPVSWHHASLRPDPRTEIWRTERIAKAPWQQGTQREMGWGLVAAGRTGGV